MNTYLWSDGGTGPGNALRVIMGAKYERDRARSSTKVVEVRTGRERACIAKIKINADLGPLPGCFFNFRNFCFHCKILFGLLHIR